jgi:hypothetical protein
LIEATILQLSRRLPHSIFLQSLEKGDVLIVTRLDRLARSTRALLNVLDEIATKKTVSDRLVIPGRIPQPRLVD